MHDFVRDKIAAGQIRIALPPIVTNFTTTRLRKPILISFVCCMFTALPAHAKKGTTGTTESKFNSKENGKKTESCD